jgi:DNA-directed RNA polymerase subunit delta
MVHLYFTISFKGVLTVSLKQYSEEQLKEFSLIELAYELFSEVNQPKAFYELVDQMATVLGVTRDELLDKLPQFYTELNIDGRFVCLGENRWGLRSWYPYDQAEEEVLPVSKPKKKRAKKYEDEEEEEFDGFDAVDEEEDFESDDDLEELDEDDDDIDDDDINEEDEENVDEYVEDDLDEDEDEEELELDEEFLDEDLEEEELEEEE